MSPFPPSSSEAGHGVIVTSVLPPSMPVLSRLSYAYPLKLISPSPDARAKCILVFLLTYGGGLVSGDATRLSVSVAAGSRLALVTQGSTKIFKASNRDTWTRQNLDVVIERDGALVYLPDPVQPFAESVYEQRQSFRLDPERGSLCVLDWVSEGRTARGEQWKLWAWKGRNEVWLSSPRSSERESGGQLDKLLLRDNVILLGDGESEPMATLERRMDGHGVFGTLILRGLLFGNLGRFFVEEFSLLPRLGAKDWSHSVHERRLSVIEAWRDARQEREKSDGVLWTAAAVRGCTVVKFGAREVEGVRTWLGDMMRREGTIEKEFGEESLLCLK